MKIYNPIIPLVLFIVSFFAGGCNTQSFRSNQPSIIMFSSDTAYFANDTLSDIITITSAPAPNETPPKIVRNVAPVYPEDELRDGIEASVVIKVWVTKTGKIKRAFVLNSTNKNFNKSALKAAMQWEFTPAIINGGPANVWVSIPFNFRLSQ